MSSVSDDVPMDIQLVRKFQNAIQDQNIDKLMELLSEFSPNVKTTRGGFRTPLTFACYYARGPIVELLLSHGANPYILDSGDQSCLVNYLSTRHLKIERDLPIISEIIKRAPLLINLRSDRGITPLYQAVGYDAPIEVIQLLINLGADPNQNGPYEPIIMTAANNLLSTIRDQTGIIQNIYPNSRDILIYLLRNTDMDVPILGEPFTRYPEIIEIFDMERKRRQRFAYNKEIAEKGKKAAILREVGYLPDDTIDEVLKYMFKRRSKKSTGRSRIVSRRSRKSKKSTRRTRKSTRSRKSTRRSRKSTRRSRKSTRSRKSKRNIRKSRV